MSQTVILGALELGGIFAILSLGLYISYKVLNLPDLTVDGSFTLGCAVSAMFTINSMPYLGIIASFLIGAVAGMVTGLLITKLKIMPLLSGILTMTGLYSINLAIMNDTPTISLFDNTTIFSSFTEFITYGKLIVIYIIVVLIVIILDLFLRTQLGLSLRACGDNEDMVRASSIDTDKMKILGLAFANGFVAMSGAIFAQHQSFADISSGTGMMVIGLASIIVGMTFIKKEKIIFQLVAVVFGAIFYRAVLTVALQLGLPSGYLKLLSALLVIIAIASTNGAFKSKKRRRN
ncbi:MAG: ABC transporter permease [Thomasclavelia sp.]